MSVRKLTKTQQTWVVDTEANARVYNTPIETGKALDSHQGKTVLPLQFLGTCGLVSCVNILRLAGLTEITEADIVDFAVKYGLCDVSLDPGSNGGTNFLHRQCILRCFGVESELAPASIPAIAHYVASGRGVIVSVDAGELWEDPQYLNGLHAIIVTSVKTDLDGTILGFYICDSGRGEDADSSRYIDVNHMARALSQLPINVTSDIIR